MIYLGLYDAMGMDYLASSNTSPLIAGYVGRELRRACQGSEQPAAGIVVIYHPLYVIGFFGPLSYLKSKTFLNPLARRILGFSSIWPLCWNLSSSNGG